MLKNIRHRNVKFIRTLLYGILVLFGTVIFISVFRIEKNPRSGFDKPEGYYDYFRRITIPFEQKVSGYSPNYSLYEYQKALANRSIGLKAASDYSWINRGPANVGGRTRTVVIDPDDLTGNTWFAGSVSGGIWKTIDGGNSWNNLTPLLPNLSTASLAMAMSNTSVLYAGTGEGYGGEGMVSGNGIYKSIDKGMSWNALTTTQKDENFRFVNKLWVSPTHEDTLLAATNRGLFRTSDGGLTWDSVFVKGYAVQDISQNPLNELVLYAGVNTLGIIKSCDGGKNWESAYNGMAEVRRVSVSVSSVDTSYVFAGVEAPGNQTHIYHSRDAGKTWQLNYNSDGLFTNFHKEQGWFNNVVAAHPFDRSKVFVGGVNLGLLDFTSGTFSNTQDVLRIDSLGTNSFMSFVNFGGAYFGGALSTGLIEEADVEKEDFVSIEIRFDTNLSQKAHRFTVPVGEGSGVPPESYTYEDYVDVPFQAWDVENNRQLMISFRDQDRNGKFNLVERVYGDDISGREYIFVHAVEYSDISPSIEIAQTGGYEYKQLYFLWPTLPEDKIWHIDSISNAVISIKYGNIEYRHSYTTILADDRLNEELHVDHHDIQFYIPDSEIDSFIIVEANDGGLGFSADRGLSWKQINRDYLTTQFYGAAKRYGRHEYIGGMQDNGTWQSPVDLEAKETSDYDFRIEGDGFEALWHPWYPQRILASSYNNLIKISNDFGENWQWVDNNILGDGPFITKLSNSVENPDLVFAVGSKGVYRHTNFGFGTAPWQLIDLGDNWAVNNTVTSSHNVKVSLANPKYVWAGGGMFSEPNLNLFLSEDYGQNFDTLANYTDVELGYLSGFATHPTNEAEAFALFSFSKKPKILRTMDFGQTWEDISGFSGHNGDSSINGFPDVVVNDLLVLPNDTNTIWAATEIGLFESIDNGLSWNYAKSQIPAVAIWQLDYSDGQVVAATHGRGIWSADLGITYRKKIEKETSRIDIYPNPASNYVNVRIFSVEEINGLISIIDLTGKKILEHSISGITNSDEISIDISMLSSGNYILLLTTKEGNLARKLIIN